MSFKDLAVTLATKGVPVIRLQPKSKIPMDKGWEKLATTDIDKILAWDAETPGANCASVAKSDGVLFFETDEAGVIERYEKETGESFPQTFKVKSRDDRFHYYFLQTDDSRACGNITQKQIPFGSLRQHNEYCVSPGSIHPITKLPYELIDDSPIIPIPAKLIEWLQKQIVKKATTSEAPATPGAKIPHGQIHGALLHEAGRLRRSGHTIEAIEVALLSWAHEHCQAPIDKSKVKQIARSMGKYDPSDPRLNNLKKVYTDPDVEILPAEVKAPEDSKYPTPDKTLADYPLWAFEGTLYEDFALLCGQGNYIAQEYFIESIKTIVGAIAGHRLQPHTIGKEQPARFYTILIGDGGSGKSTAAKWAADLFIGTGLLYETSQSGAFMNIGAAKARFGSQVAMEEGFIKHPRILQTSDEVTTMIEKFSINGSGGSYLDISNELFEYTPTLPQCLTKGSGKNPAPIREVHYSVLGCTTPRRWQNSFKKSNTENSGFFQRLNIVANTNVRTVPELATPDFTELKDRFVRKIQALEYQIVEVIKTEDATELFNSWFDAKKEEWKNLPSDVTGRLQVMAQRNASHLAWLMSGEDVVPDPDKTNERIEVKCDEDIMRRAIALAEYELRVRQLHKPIEADNDYALVENMIEQHFVSTGGKPTTKRRLYRILHADRHGTKIFDSCIDNLVREGIISRGRYEGETKRGRKADVIMWIGEEE
jgi:hypothetical protein